MTPQELAVEISRLNEVIAMEEAAALDAAKDRPKAPEGLSFGEVLEGFRDKEGKWRHLPSEQKAWDAANPDVATRRKGHIDASRAALAEVRRLEQQARIDREAEEHAWGLLECVPRISETLRSLGPRLTGEAVEATKAFAKADGKWCLLMLGGTGCGKSTAAADFFWRFARSNGSWRSCDPVWVRASEAARHSGFGEETEERLALWRKSHLLVLDDLGTEMLTPTWQQALDDILDDRYQHSLSTIITSNLVAADFKTRYGERVSDRIREDGMVVTLVGRSLRRSA